MGRIASDDHPGWYAAGNDAAGPNYAALSDMATFKYQSLRTNKNVIFYEHRRRPPIPGMKAPLVNLQGMKVAIGNSAIGPYPYPPADGDG